MAKIVSGADARNENKRLRDRIKELEKELAEALKRKEGVHSSGVEDKYTLMNSDELRALIIKRGGNPDEIVEGYHSRQRSIMMREWLRANPAHTSAKGKRITKVKVSEKNQKIASSLRPLKKAKAKGRKM